MTVWLAAVPALGTPVAAGGGGDEEDDTPVVVASSPDVGARRSTGPAVAFDADWLRPFFTGGIAHQAATDFRQEQWLSAEAGFSKAAARLPRASDERQAARFMAALATANLSRWAEAASRFEALFRDYPRLRPYHAYNAARCRLRDGDAQAALAWADKVEADNVPEAEAQLVKLDALRALGRWQEVARLAADYLGRFRAGPRRSEARFKQAEALEELAAEDGAPAMTSAERADLVALYRRVWTDSPIDEWGARAAERLDAIAASLPPAEAAPLRTRTASEWVDRGMVLFDKNRNQESEAAFASALAAPALDVDLECRARFHLAQSVWKQRQRPRAAPLFDQAEPACARAGNRDLHAKSLYQAARSWAAAGDSAAAQSRFARVEAEHPEHSYADDARLRAAELASDQGDDEAAAKLLSEIPDRYPTGDMLGEALWRLAFFAWRAGRYPEAAGWLDESLRRIPHEDIWYAEGRALYWKARVLEKQQEPASARAFYARAVREYPLSVYALLALGRLSATSARTRQALLRELRDGAGPAAFHFAARPLFGDGGFRRAVDLARMGQGGDARRELARLGLLTSGDKHAQGRAARDEDDLLWMSAVLLDRGGVWSASHSIPRYTLTDYRLAYPRGLGATKWRLSYPRAYPDLVARDTRAEHIPEALELAIMREESAFSPRIESPANAVGLTQLLVKTAKRFSKGAPVTRESLMDPVKNLEVGSRFLGSLWGRFAKSAPLAIAGYNAGEAAVDRWLAERGHLSMDEFLETIPYDETRNYTKRVLASYFAYCWLYDGKHPVPSVPIDARP